MMMQTIDRLLLGKTLTTLEAEIAFRALFRKKKREELFGKLLLVLLQKKGEHPNELTGLIQTIRNAEKRLSGRSLDVVDGCGTGGDGKKSFNISTIACIIAAGAGAYVAKHGNRSLTSQCGSADLLESLGVKIEAPSHRMLTALRKGHLGYFHAPLYHPLFAQIQPIRKELAQRQIKTIFNLAGPLVNPLRPKRQVIGVYRKNYVPVIAQTLRNLGLKRVLVFWNTGGFDELTTAASSFAIELSGGKLKQKTLSPFSLGLKRSKQKDLKGGNDAFNRRIALRILSGKDRGPRLDNVLLNAAAILYISGRAKNLKDGIKIAKRSVKSGSALHSLKQLIRISHGTK